jgi:DNA-binding transcriptional MerR regulator
MSDLTVQKLAKISGTTVRTLHYYDEVGLLKPTFIAENGYRYYDKKAQLKLQQILFFKELDFSLEQIRKVLGNPNIEKLELLKDQKQLLQLKKKRLEKIMATIDETIIKEEGGEDSMSQNNDDLYGAFTKRELEEFEKEAKVRWGDTKAYKQSIQRTKSWTKDDYVRVQKEWGVLLSAMAEKMDQNTNSEEIQAVVDRIYQHLFQFYDPNIEMFRGLGQMYVEDVRFKKTFEKIKPGLAEFTRDAITFYCDMHER